MKDMWPAGQKCEQRQTCSRRPSELCLRRAPPAGTMHHHRHHFHNRRKHHHHHYHLHKYKKNITTRAPSELRISEFTLIFSINSRLLADILSYLGNVSNSSWLRFYSDNLSKNLITTFTTIIILIALVTTLMPVSLRLASNQPQNRFCWFHSDSPCLTRNRHILLVVMWVDQVKKRVPAKSFLGDFVR